MKTFVQCSEPVFNLQGSEHKNETVNLALCPSFYKSVHVTRADGSGQSLIHFRGVEVSWYYSTKSKRDKDYDRLLSLVALDYVTPGETNG